MAEKDISDSKNNISSTVVVKEDCDVTIKLAPEDMERTMKLSNEELRKALQQKRENETDRKISKTSFFNMSKTSSFSGLFEKKRDVEENVQSHTEERNISSENLSDIDENGSVLQNLEKSFEIISRIGEGGQGTVSTAADRSLGRIVALKSLHKDLLENKKSREHFIAEAKITAQLDYPGIVPVYSLSHDDENGLHLAMKLINGETLTDYLNNIREQYSKDGIRKFKENNSLRKRLEIFLHVCDAVAYAHSRNVMHCDLKPENIMLGQYNDSYIMDWGIARLIEDPALRSGKHKKPKTISGTPRYLSPEAIEGKYIDERADIYALGLILFESVFLKAAFNGSDTKEVLTRVRNGEIEKFSHAFNYPVSKDLVAIIRKAAAFDRDKRYQSVNELADDIRHYMANEETVARPDNIIGKVIRFSQRHVKTILVLILLWILLAGGALSHSVYQQYRHNQFILERDMALSTAYSKALYVAGLIELQMNNVANSLKSLSAYISFLMKYDTPHKVMRKQYFFVPDEFKKAQRSPDIFFSEACNMPISIDRMSFNHPNGRYTAEMRDVMEKIQLIQPILKKSLLYDNIFRQKDEKNDLTEKEAEKYYMTNGSPILWFYGGFENGLYFNLPGQVYDQSNFDPRQRTWYKVAAKKTPFDDVVWSTPYQDAYSKRKTLSASLPIFVDGAMHGVVAVDNMLLYISRFMKNNGNIEGFLLEKIIVDANGKSLMSTREDYSVQRGVDTVISSGIDREFFENEDVFPYVRKNKSGVMNVITENDRNIVYLFYRINSLNWYYIEKIDMDMLMDHIQTQKK